MKHTLLSASLITAVVTGTLLTTSHLPATAADATEAKPLELRLYVPSLARRVAERAQAHPLLPPRDTGEEGLVSA